MGNMHCTFCGESNILSAGERCGWCRSFVRDLDDKSARLTKELPPGYGPHHFYGNEADFTGPLSECRALRAIGVLPEFLEGHLDFQLVKQTIEWKAPARFDQVLELSIAAIRLGTTSFTIGTTFRIAGEQKPIATVETVYVLVDGRTLTKVALPDSLRAALQQGAAGAATDHAAFL